MEKPFSLSDRSLFSLQEYADNLPQEVVVWFRFSGTFDWDRLQRTVADTVDRIPRLRWKVSDRVPHAFADDEEFDLQHHLIREDPSISDFRSRIAELLIKRRDLSRPLWSFHHWPKADLAGSGGSSLLMTLNHVVGDGWSIFYWSQVLQGLGRRFNRGSESSKESAVPMARRIRVLSKFVRMVLGSKSNRSSSCCSGNNSSNRCVDDVFVDDLAVRQAQRRYGCSVHEVVFGIVARGLALYRQSTSDDESVSMVVPLPYQQPSFGNNVYPCSLTVPTAGQTLPQILERISDTAASLKDEATQDAFRLLNSLIDHLPVSWRMWFQLKLGRMNSCLATLVPTGRRKYDIAGLTVAKLSAFAPLLPGQGLSVTALRYGDQLSLGLVMDPGVIADPAALVGCIRKASQEL